MSDFHVKCWAGGWGLPSIDPECLSVIAYGHLAKANINVQAALPRNTITGMMPELQLGDLVYSTSFSIFGIFRRDGYNLEYNLQADKHADTFAFLSYIQQKLKPALLYALWMDNANYIKVTRPAYAQACGLPWSLYYPRKLRETVMDQLTQMYQNYKKNNVNELEKYLNKNAFECLNVLEKKLGDNDYFFGATPSTMDAVIYGYLGLLLKAPLVSTGLQNHLNTCEKLKNLLHRIERCFPKYPNVVTNSNVDSASNSGKSPVMKKEQFITLLATVAAMVTFVMTSGVLTSQRSKLAQRMGTVERRRHHHHHREVVEFDDDDDED